jgi:6-pyruvoyltetrahydropterin/6-carboxytetrahydropterin synthase
MYTVCIRDHLMIAHSFAGALFGPAQRLHGATYVVDVELRSHELTPDGVVVDIGRAAAQLRDVLAELDYRNLDDIPAFSGKNTTTEFLARAIFERMARGLLAGALEGCADRLASMKVTLHESHVAWAAYEAPVAERTQP